jgi:hypothetical protein
MQAALADAVSRLQYKNFMVKVFLFILVMGCGICQTGFAQIAKPTGDDLNKLDENGKKHGMWVNTIPAKKGEKPFSEFGNYEHDLKYGTWYKLTKEGELIAIENFKNNLLEGDAKYYDQGKLYCEGSYMSKSSSQEKDTIVVTHPETLLESNKELPAYYGSFRQGEWRYYDTENGKTIRIEEYAEDELIYKRNLPNFFSDSVAFKKREAMLPHNLMKKTSLPKGKKQSYLNY